MRVRHERPKTERPRAKKEAGKCRILCKSRTSRTRSIACEDLRICRYILVGIQASSGKIVQEWMIVYSGIPYRTNKFAGKTIDSIATPSATMLQGYHGNAGS